MQHKYEIRAGCLGLLPTSQLLHGGSCPLKQLADARGHVVVEGALLVVAEVKGHLRAASVAIKGGAASTAAPVRHTAQTAALGRAEAIGDASVSLLEVELQVADAGAASADVNLLKNAIEIVPRHPESAIVGLDRAQDAPHATMLRP